MLHTAVGSGSGGWSGTEASFGLGDPDLYPHTIDLIRLVVNKLDYEYKSGSYNLKANITWEFLRRKP